MPRRKIVLQKHIRKAIEIAKQGGTKEHPYDQSTWGDIYDKECGTACCVWGHALLQAGLEPRGWGPGIDPGIDTYDEEDLPDYNEHDAYVCRVVRLMTCPSEDVLKVMSLVKKDGSLDLSGMDLSGLRLPEIDLCYSKAENTNFSNTNLRDARFIEARLSEANFRDADVRGADFRCAVLGAADFSRALTQDAEGLPDYLEPSVTLSPWAFGIGGHSVLHFEGVPEVAAVVTSKGEVTVWDVHRNIVVQDRFRDTAFARRLCEEKLKDLGYLLSPQDKK